MKNLLDRTMIYSAYAYITIPFLIFTLGWIRLSYAIPIVGIVIVSTALSLKQYDLFRNVGLKNKLKKVLLVFVIIIVWVLLSGIGGYSLQNHDHFWRNAVLHDLINYDWPVIYKIHGLEINHELEGKSCMLVYYIGYWLPSALIGKIGGWDAANFSLFIWTIIGLTLTYYFLCRLFSSFSLRILLIFIFWGELCIIGILFTFSIRDILISEFNLYAGSMVYPSNTGLLYWVFNQTVTSWLIIVLLFNKIPPRNILFLYGLCLFQSSYAFLGLFPFIVYFMAKSYSRNKLSVRGISDRLFELFSFQNIFGFSIVFLITLLYFKSNPSSENFAFLPRNMFVYFAFITLEFGFVSLLMYKKYKREPIYYIAICSLLIIPFFYLGAWVAFVARVSIPSLFILMLLSIRYVFEEKKDWRMIILVICLFVGAFPATKEILRSSAFLTVQSAAKTNICYLLQTQNNRYVRKFGFKLEKLKHKNILIKDNLGTISNPNNHTMRNWMGVIDDSFFYKYIAKKGS